MIASAPFIPLNGGSPTLYAVLALLVGAGFGFFLERAGFGSAKKLTSVFTLRDWQVYKVMFTALITALVGSQILSGLGVLDLSLVEVGSTMLLPMAVGGLLFGVGFYFGGFCPGTAVVSAVRGRLDAVVFLVGVLGGMYAFAVFFDGPGQADWFQSFYQPVGARVMRLYGTIPVWVLAIVIPIGVIVSFRYVDLLTHRFALMTPEQLERGESRPKVRMPALAPVAKVALASVGAVLVVVGVIRPSDPASVAVAAETPRVVGLDVDTTVDALSVVGWVVSDAHRVAEDGPANSYVLDVRTADERAAAPIGTAIELEPTADTGTLADDAIAAIDDAYGEAARNKPIVVLSSADPASTTAVVRSLREHGINAFALDGGADAWRAVVFDDPAPWPAAVVDRGADATGIAAYRERVVAWLRGGVDTPPAYVPIPGTLQLPSEVATGVATGGGGGGCG